MVPNLGLGLGSIGISAFSGAPGLAPHRKQPRSARSAPRRRELPNIDASLIDERIEVMWELTYNRRGGGEYVTKQWCAGTIKDVSATSTFDTSGPKRRKLGLGHIWVVYDDGTVGWLLATRPTFYKGNKPGAWRFEGDAPEDMDVDGDGSDSVVDDELEDAESDESDESDDDDL